MKVLLTALSLSLAAAVTLAAPASPSPSQSQSEPISAWDTILLSQGDEVSLYMWLGESHAETKLVKSANVTRLASMFHNMADGEDITYVASADEKMIDGKKRLVVHAGTVWIGTRVASQADGTCLKTVTTLTQMKTVESNGASIQVPETKTGSSIVACPL